MKDTHRIVYVGAGERQGELVERRTPKEVRRSGYGFTADVEKAWTFPNEKQAKAKLRVLERHFSWPHKTGAEGLFAVEEIENPIYAAMRRNLQRMSERPPVDVFKLAEDIGMIRTKPKKPTCDPFYGRLPEHYREKGTP